MALRPEDGRDPKQFLDAKQDKDEQKRRLVDTIDSQMDGVERGEIEAAVDARYEALIEEAEVNQHVPTLAEGQAKSALRDGKRKDKG